MTRLDEITQCFDDAIKALKRAPDPLAIEVHCICQIQVGKLPDGVSKQSILLPISRDLGHSDREAYCDSEGEMPYTYNAELFYSRGHTSECKAIMRIHADRQLQVLKFTRYNCIQHLCCGLQFSKVHYTATNHGTPKQQIVFLKLACHEIASADRFYHTLYPSENDGVQWCPVTAMMKHVEAEISDIAANEMRKVSEMLGEVPKHLTGLAKDGATQAQVGSNVVPIVPKGKAP